MKDGVGYILVCAFLMRVRMMDVVRFCAEVFKTSLCLLLFISVKYPSEALLSQ